MVLEFRLDPTKNSIVLVASKRAKRPTVFGKKVTCPFCKGSENVTPPTKYALPNEKNWDVRCFNNAFHLVTPGAYRKMTGPKAPAYGEHEVIVESGTHEKLWQDFDEEELARVYTAYAHRLQALRKKKHIQYALLFKNHGRNGGASIEHEHAQLVALPFVPETLEREAQAAAAFRKRTKKCIYCELLKTERKNILLENEHFAALCPSFARFPFETWIIPKTHTETLTRYPYLQAKQFMELLRECIRRICRVTPDYNFAFHESPAGNDVHAHVEIVPRTGHWAGLELGGGLIVNGKGEQESLAVLRADGPAEKK